MCVQFGVNLYSKTFKVNDLKTHYLDSPRPKQMSRQPRSKKQNFVMLVQFDEKLCWKTSDVNDLKTRYLYSPMPKQISQTVIEKTNFRSVCEKLCSKIFDTNDLKNTLFGLLKA